MDIPTIPIIIALVLSVHGWRKKSLSGSGALTAFVVGVTMMAGGTCVFGVGLIGLYVVGSRATKCECVCDEVGDELIVCRWKGDQIWTGRGTRGSGESERMAGSEQQFWRASGGGTVECRICTIECAGSSVEWMDWG